MQKVDPNKLKQNARKPLNDDIYHAVLQVHQPLIAYVVTHYKEEIYNQNRASITVFGDYTLPLAIEFTQWRYDVTFVARKQVEFEEIPEITKRFGAKIKTALWFNYLTNAPRATVIVFVDVFDTMPSSRSVISWTKILLRRCREIVCSQKIGKDWKGLLEPYFEYKEEPYPKGGRILISLREKKEPVVEFLNPQPDDEQEFSQSSAQLKDQSYQQSSSLQSALIKTSIPKEYSFLKQRPIQSKKSTKRKLSTKLNYQIVFQWTFLIPPPSPVRISSVFA
jgi:hypothetical protein